MKSKIKYVFYAVPVAVVLLAGQVIASESRINHTSFDEQIQRISENIKNRISKTSNVKQGEMKMAENNAFHNNDQSNVTNNPDYSSRNGSSFSSERNPNYSADRNPNYSSEREVEDESLWEKTKETSSDAWDKTKEMSSDAWDKTKEVSSDAWDKTKEVSSDAWEATKDAFD